MNLKVSFSQKLLLILCLAAVYIIWGSTFLAIRVGIETIPPFMLGALRFIAAGAFVKLLFFKKYGKVEKPPVWWRALSGFFLFTMGNGSVIIAEERLPSGIAALTCATIPVITVLLGYAFKQAEKFTLKIAISCILGTVGVWFLTLNENSNYQVLDILMILAGALAWAVASLGSRKYKYKFNITMMVDDQMLWGGIFFLVFAIIHGEFSSVNYQLISGRSLLATAYLSVFGSVIAFSAYMWLIANASSDVATSYAYVNPIIAIALGYLLGGETIGVEVIWAGLFIIASVVLTLYVPKKSRVTKVIVTEPN